MSSNQACTTRLLLCSSSEERLQPLKPRLAAAGVSVDFSSTADQARQLLWDQHYDGVAVDLLMADRDGISFAMELRQEHPWISILVISSTRHTPRSNKGPDWLTRTSDYARLIFALKQAGQRTAGRSPRILHVEDNDDLADLVKNTIGSNAQLFRARSTQEARIAMAIRNYDLALIRTQASAQALSRDSAENPTRTLIVNTDTSDDPLLALLNNLRRKPFVHEPAYC